MKTPMTDATSIFKQFTFRPARNLRWQKTADFLMKLGAFGFPFTGLAFTHMFPNHDILGVLLCVFAPMTVGFAMQEWYQSRRRLYDCEKFDYQNKLRMAQEQDASNPIWSTLLDALNANTMSARQWYKLDDYLPTCVAVESTADPQMGDKSAIKHLKL